MKGTKKWDIIIEALMRMKVDFQDTIKNSTKQAVIDVYTQRILEIDDIYRECVTEWYNCKIAEDADSKKFEVRNDD